MRAQDFPGWLAAIAGLSAEQRGEAVLGFPLSIWDGSPRR